MKKFVLFAILSVAVGCAPKVQERNYPEPLREFKPRLEDTDLKAKYPDLQRFDFNTSAFWEGDVKWGAIHRQIEHLAALGNMLNQPELVQAGKNLLIKSRSITETLGGVQLAASPYLELAIPEIQDETVKTLKEASADLAEAEKKTMSALARTAGKYQFPKTIQDFNEVATHTVNFLTLFKAEALKEEMMEAMKTELVKELDQKMIWVQGLTAQLSELVKKEKNLGILLAQLEVILKKEDVELDKDLQDSLGDGKALAADLANCKDAQGALTALVGVWNILTPAEREQYIKPVSKDLYEFLDGKGKSSLNCLRKKNCSGFVRDFIKHAFVLPKIKEYGALKICQEINDQGVGVVAKSLLEAGPKTLAEVPKTVEDSLKEGIAEKQKMIADISGDFPKFVKDSASTWAKANLKTPLFGFEPHRVLISMKNGEFQLAAGHSGRITSAEGVGSSLSVYKMLWDGLNPETDREFLIQTGIEQVNKLAALAGYKNSKQAEVPAFLQPIEAEAPPLDLRRLKELTLSYAMPDELEFNQDQQPILKYIDRKNYSVRSQSEMIRGLSQMIAFFQDWNVTSHEKALGTLTAQDFIPQFQSDELKRQMFPKEQLLALTLGEAATLLKNITKKSSQFFLVDLQNNVKWASEYDPNGEETTAMAGVVDLIHGERGTSVTAENVSRMILALAEFMRATNGIENTKSTMLQEVGSDGKTALESIVEGRKDLKLLIVGLSNLISHQFISKDALVARSLRLATLDPDESENMSVTDQAITIRALLAASEATGIRIYEMSAIDLYYAMNKHLFNPKIRFYSAPNNLKGLPMPAILETLRALVELRPALGGESLAQLDWVINPWLEALKTLK